MGLRSRGCCQTMRKLRLVKESDVPEYKPFSFRWDDSVDAYEMIPAALEAMQEQAQSGNLTQKRVEFYTAIIDACLKYTLHRITSRYPESLEGEDEAAKDKKDNAL